MPIKKFFKVEPGEERLVALAFFQAVLIGFPGIFTLTVAHSLFLENYAASNLPYVYLVSSLIIPIAGISYLHFAKKVVFITLQIRILWLISIILLANILLLWWLPDLKWPTFVLLVWFNLEWMLLEFGYWSVANRLFTIRQSKRLFGLIWSGEILTAIIGGLLMSYLINIMGIVNLLLLSLVGLILALVNLTYMSQVFKSQFTEEKITHNEKTSSLFTDFQNRYVLLILAFAIFSVYIVYFFVDNIFYYQLNEHFHDSTQIAIFLGQFWAVYGFFSLFSRAFISGRWITQVGLLGGLLTSPIMLGICVISIIIVSQFLNSLVLLFGLIILAKLLEEVLSGAIQSPCYYTLFQAISQKERSRVQTSIELILAPMIGIFVAGASLWLLNKYFEFTTLGLSIVLFLILIILVFIILLTIKQYKKALTSNLNLNNLLVRNPLDDLVLSDPYTLQILEQGLKSPRSEEVVFCLKSLEEGNFLKIKQILLEMISHQNPSVRIAVYQTIEKLKNKVFYLSLKKQLFVEKNILVQAALLLALGATGKSDAFECIKTYLNNKRPEILQAVIISMIRYCGNEGLMNAGNILKEFKDSTNTDKRVFAAQVLGNIGISNFHRWLLPLLKDKQIKVRKAALIAASHLNNPQLLPLVLKNLNNPTFKKEALKVLLNIKEADFPFLDSAYNVSAPSIQIHREIIQVYGRFKSQAAITRLIKQLNDTKRELRHDILTALQACHYKALLPKDKQLVEKYLQKEVNYSIQILANLSEQIIKEEFPLLYSALNQELDKTRNNIFLLLSFIYPSDTIKKIAHYWKAKQAQREMAIELLEHTLNQTHQKLILQVLQKHSLIKKEPLDELIIQILCHPEHSAWIKSCAIDVALIMFPIGDFQELIQPFLNDSNEWIRETAHYSFSLTGIKENSTTSLPIIEKVKILQSVEIFSDIHDEMLAEMNTVLEDRKIKKGEYIYQQGKLASSMYIIADGLVATVHNQKILENLQAGDIFGEMSALVPEKRYASVMAIEDSHLFQLSKGGLQELMKARPEVARKIIIFLCYRLGSFKRKQTVNLNKKINRNFFDKSTINFPLSLVKKIILFRNVSIFSQTPYNTLAKIAELSTEVVLKKNELLFKKGEINTNMYIIVDGWVKIYDDENLIAELGERQTIGELSMFFSDDRNFSIAALENTRLLSLSKEILFELMLDQHEIVEGIILVLVQRLRYLMKNQHENVL